MADILTAEQLNAIAKGSGYTGGTFSSVGLPTTPTKTETPQTPVVTPPSPTGLDDASFISSLNGMQQGFNQNNDLLKQRSALLQQLYTGPGTLKPEQLAALPPDIAQLIQSGNQPLMQVQLQAINDSLAGRQNSLAQSIQYLTTGYQQAEKAQQDAYTTVLNYSKATGSKPSDIMKGLYPSLMGQMSQAQLKSLDNISAAWIPSTAQNVGAGAMDVTIPTGTIAADTNNPLNIKYSPSSPAGGTDSGITAQDGGTFAAFGSPEEGLQGAIDLLTSPVYSDLTVDQAMKKWSNGAYGAEVSPSMNPTQTISSLSDSGLQQLVSDMAQRESGTSTAYKLSDIQAIAKGIEEGSQPPDLSRLYGKSAQVKAQLQRDGFDLTKATLDWTATQAFVKNSNSTQQVRMRQAENSVEQSLPLLQVYVDKLNQDGAMSGFKFVNKASITAAANGAFGKQAADDAQALIGQIALVTDELGQTFMGGNSPTDAAFALAKGVFASNFTADQFKTQIKLVGDNLNIRKNSWKNAGTVTIGGTNTYGGSSGSSGDNSDISKMTDAELQAIINGQ